MTESRCPSCGGFCGRGGCEREDVQPEQTVSLEEYKRLQRLVTNQGIRLMEYESKQEPVAWGFQNTAITGSNRWMYLRETIPTNDQYRGVLWTPLYTAPPEQPLVGLTDEDREILEAVRRELHRGNQDGNAPGHVHEVPGIWDSDNGERAGKPCAWCLTWKKFTTLIDRESTLKDKKK